MAELFGRVTLGPDNYKVNEWTPLYSITSNTVGGLIFDVSVTNVTPMSGHPAKKITVEAKIVDRDGKLVHYLLAPHQIEPNGVAWDTTQKLVFEPGDKLMVKADAHGISFYAAIVKGLRIV